MHARNEPPRERCWIDSLRLHVEANSAESFNFLCKWATRNWPRSYSYPLPSIFPSRIHRGSRSILFYRPLEEMRGRPALIKTLNRKCGLRRNGGGWWYVELSRSNRTSETSGTFDINRFYVCIINLVENCVSIKIILDQGEFFCSSL